MGEGSEVLWRWTLVASVVWGCVTVAHAEPTYRYRTREGRDAFTNVRSLVPPSVAAEDVELMSLPELTNLDFEAANEAELQRINERLERTHAALLASDPCRQAIEDASLPWYRRMYEKEPHWVWLAGLFVAMAVMGKAMSGWLPAGLWGRTMFFLAPLLLAVGLLGSLAARMSDTLAAVRREHGACTSELSPVGAGDRNGIRQRAGIVGDVQRVLQARSVRMDRELDRISRIR